MDLGILFEAERFLSKCKPYMEHACQVCEFQTLRLTLRTFLYHRPADLTSYCVCDFSKSNRHHELVTSVLERSKQHGLKNVQYENEHSTVTRAVTVNAGLGRGGNVAEQVRTVVLLLRCPTLLSTLV